jgi:hypothetical protein
MKIQKRGGGSACSPPPPPPPLEDGVNEEEEEGEYVPNAQLDPALLRKIQTNRSLSKLDQEVSAFSFYVPQCSAGSGPPQKDLDQQKSLQVGPGGERIFYAQCSAGSGPTQKDTDKQKSEVNYFSFDEFELGHDSVYSIGFSIFRYR